MRNILGHITILAAIGLATWIFLNLLNREVERRLPPLLYYSDIEHVSRSAHASRLCRPREVKP